MSKFYLTMEYPKINYDWYTPNTDGTPKCPSHWKVIEEDELWLRFSKNADGDYFIKLRQGESAIIPFKTSDIPYLQSSTRYPSFTFKELVFEGATNTSEIEIWFNDNDKRTISISNGESPVTHTTRIFDNTEFIRIFNPNDFTLYFFTDFHIQIATEEYDFDYDLANFDIKLNKQSKTTNNGTLVQSKTANNYTTYNSQIAVKHEEEKVLFEVFETCRLNNIPCYFNVLVESMGGDFSDLPQIATEKYLLTSIDRNVITGLYSYITLRYEKQGRGV